MAKAPKIYQRLPGTGATVTHRVRLYQGPDHLLQVASTGYSETYKRFYYRDIQAFLVHKTPNGKRWTLAWAILAVVWALPAVASSGVTAGVFATFSLFFFGCLVLHLSRGPTCATHARTAVQTERLPSLNRLPTARRVLARVKPLITAVQGELATDDFRLRYEGGPAASPLAPEPEPPITA